MTIVRVKERTRRGREMELLESGQLRRQERMHPERRSSSQQ